MLNYQKVSLQGPPIILWVKHSETMGKPAAKFKLSNVKIFRKQDHTIPIACWIH